MFNTNKIIRMYILQQLHSKSKPELNFVKLLRTQTEPNL